MNKNFNKNSNYLTSRNQSNQLLNNRQIEKYGLGSVIMNKVGFSEEEYPMLNLIADLATYANPYTGLATAGIDAYNALKEGNLKDAGVEAAFAIPFVGSVGKAAKTYGKLQKAASSGSKAAKKTMQVADKAHKFSNTKSAKLASAAATGVIGRDIYNSVSQPGVSVKAVGKGVYDATKDELKRAATKVKNWGEDVVSQVRNSRIGKFVGNLW